MRILNLSEAATAGLELKYPGKVRSVALRDLASELCATHSPAVVVGEPSQIDNRFADGLYAAGLEGISVGIVPYDPQYTESFWRLLRPGPPVRDHAATIGLYSSRGLKFDLPDPPDPVRGNIVRLRRKSENQGKITSPDDASRQIIAHDFTALAVITEGRQTYCLLGMGCLHPTISEPKLGRLAPRDIKSRHWLLQSCHSPFVWPELGSYLTVPLSIALTSNAETVICSTHVQTYIPGLLKLYTEKLLHGWSMGDVVRALNDLAASTGVDHRPFMLIGNPESKVITPNSASTPQIPAATRISSTQLAKNLMLLRRLITNVEFLCDPKHFGFVSSENDASSKNNAFSRFSRDTEWLLRFDLRSLSKFAGPAADVGILLERIQPQNVSVSFDRATKNLSKAWKDQGGFYAVGEKLDENYSAEGASETDYRCLVCGEGLIERRLSYFGQSRSAEYSERSQKICPRCLVVEHVSPIHRVSTQVAAKRTADELQINISYTNASTEPQWIFAFAFLSDPNNISKSTAPKSYDSLLASIAIRTAKQAPVSLEPGGTFQFSFNTGPVPEKFWYLLVEVNLMVDFCWNWYSFTYRAKQIEKWLSSPEYRDTLPRTRP